MNRRSVVTLFVLLVTFACAPSNAGKELHTAGLPASLGGAFGRSRALPPVKMAAIGRSLAQAGSRTFFTPGGSSQGANVGRKVLKAGYIKAVSEAEGIPRAQGEDILRKVMSDDYGSCGGVSCAQIYGVDPLEVPKFFDEVFLEVAASQALSKTEQKGQRNLLFSSFAKEEALSASSNPHPEDEVARIFMQDADEIPSAKAPPAFQIQYQLASDKVGDDFIRAIEGYTDTHADTLRVVESYSDQVLQGKGWQLGPIAHWRQESDLIYRGFSALPVYQGTVFRGISRLKPSTIARWKQRMERREPMGLGLDENPALTSATWDPVVAQRFASTWHPFFKTDAYSVFMVIEQNRGLAIEKISYIPGEKEVLLPRNGMYMIEKMAPIQGYRGVILMKLREVPRQGSKRSQVPLAPKAKAA